MKSKRKKTKSMGSKTTNTLQEHSKAKVNLYKRYLSIYLNIIKRVEFITKVLIFDLFAGEGKYENGEMGSSLSTLDVIRKHYFSNNNSCKDIEIFFNDNGYSKIEPHKTKIERIKDFASAIYCPNNVTINYEEIPYSDLIQTTLERVRDLKEERALLFIDPWGYKDINPSELKELLKNKKSEIILFLPIAHMYRFAEKSLNDEEFPGGKPLMRFLNSLSIDEKELPSTQKGFIDKLKSAFYSTLDVKYVDTYMIEKSRNEYFCLFFFTNNQTGYKSMLKAKWDEDEREGKGFRIGDSNAQQSMFDVVEVSNYDSLLINYIKNSEGVTNGDLLEFGLRNGYLPSHTNQVLNQIKSRLEVTSLDETPVKGFYIDNKIRKVRIKYK